ncbi:LysE family transporter [uncultured Devosia sp.]|uniref:LysE family transporter n=1 Tax=uncultured Devosia sp. TaxID=211434 RepID=UPI0035CC3A2E
MAFPWLEWAGLMLAFGINAVIPGADFAMVLRQAIAHDRRASLFTSAGIAASILVHGSYTLLGVGVIVGQSLLLFNILKWAGAAYLMWLALSALRSAPPTAPDIAVAGDVKRGDWAAFGLGFLTNLLNPKAVLFFLALFTTLVSAQTAGEVKIVYVACMSIMLFAWFALVSVFFTTANIRQGFFRLGRWFNRVTGITFILLAVRVAVSQQH